MKVSAIQEIGIRNYITNSNKNVLCSYSKPSEPGQDTVCFKSKGGKFLGGLFGGAAGGAAGGAIIGGGSLAGMWTMASALGPLGWGLAALYTVGGALAGGYLGAGVGDDITGEDKNSKHES